MFKEVHLECLGRLPCLEALNKEKNQRAILKGKIRLEHWSDFGCISLLKNLIDTRIDWLELWLKYLQLSSFWVFWNSQFLKAKINSRRKLKIIKVLFSLDILTSGFEWRLSRTNFGEKKTLYFLFFNGSLNSLLGLGIMFLL